MPEGNLREHRQFRGDRGVVPNVERNFTFSEPLTLDQDFGLQNGVATRATNAQKEATNVFTLPMFPCHLEFLHGLLQVRLRENPVVFALHYTVAASIRMIRE